MEIRNDKVYCFFEQSGTFKNEFIKMGIPAEDYDIQNNFSPTDGMTYQKDKQQKRIAFIGGHTGSLCDEERSMISPDYAKNFICDKILGKKQQIGQLELF